MVDIPLAGRNRILDLIGHMLDFHGDTSAPRAHRPGGEADATQG
jgi:hypothetical protein